MVETASCKNHSPHVLSSTASAAGVHLRLRANRRVTDPSVESQIDRQLSTGCIEESGGQRRHDGEINDKGYKRATPLDGEVDVGFLHAPALGTIDVT